MTIEEALEIVETALEKGRLNKVQEIVFRQAWEGKSYKEIATSSDYEEGYVRDAGAKLWQLLSKTFGKKVNKNNIHGVLKQQSLANSLKDATRTSNVLNKELQQTRVTVPQLAIAQVGTARQWQDWGEAQVQTLYSIEELKPLLLSRRNLLQNSGLPLSQSLFPMDANTGSSDRLARDNRVSLGLVSRYSHALKASGQLEYPERPLALDSPLYIERPPIEDDCYREILKPGSLIRLKAPENMGKTSLLNRILAHAAECDCRTVRLNFRQVEGAVLSNLDKFLRWFCVSVCRGLQLPSMLEMYWDEELFGSMASCTTYFQAYLLAQIDAPLVLGLDEVDRLFEYPEIARDFFALLRGWHEEANNLEIWQRLRMVVVHSTEVYIPLNIQQSPFNVGLPIHLPEFTASQVRELAARHGLDGTDDVVGMRGFTPLIEMVGGHPYLVQLALYYLRRREVTLEDLLNKAATQAGIYGDYLRSYWEKLRIHPELVDALKKVIEADKRVQLEPTLAYKLESMGLVKIAGNEATLSCELYRRYFGELLRT